MNSMFIELLKDWEDERNMNNLNFYKVEITKDIEDSVVGLLETMSAEEIFEKHKNLIENKVSYLEEEYSNLNNVSLLTMYMVLMGQYKVLKNKFKAGDWVTVEWDGDTPTTHKVNSDDGSNVSLNVGYHNDVTNHRPDKDIVRYATKEEIEVEKNRIFWYRINRSPYEYKEDDVVLFRDKVYFVHKVRHNAIVLTQDKEHRGNMFHVIAEPKDKDLKLVSTVAKRYDLDV